MIYRQSTRLWAKCKPESLNELDLERMRLDKLALRDGRLLAILCGWIPSGRIDAECFLIPSPHSYGRIRVRLADCSWSDVGNGCYDFGLTRLVQYYYSEDPREAQSQVADMVQDPARITATETMEAAA